MLDGLDEALAGMSAGEAKTFPAELAGGAMAGATADVTVTVESVKVKELPELDDEFAQSASEFDTVGELRAGTREQLEKMRRAGQAGQAKERALQALLDRIDIPLPEGLISREAESRRQQLADRVQRSGGTMDDYLQAASMSAEQLDEQFTQDARRNTKAMFVLDKLAAQEELTLDQTDLAAYVTEQAYRMGVPADRLAKELTDSGQLGSAAADVLRTKALTLLAERATVTDESGRPVDIKAAAREADAEDAEAEDDGADEDGADDDMAGEDDEGADDDGADDDGDDDGDDDDE
jgi:trigger factor